MCDNLTASANHLSLSHWQCHCHIHDNRNTFKYACSGLAYASTHVYAEHTHTRDVCAPETHPQSVLRLACDKQLRCEVWNADLSRRCAVSVWGCSEWWSRDGESTSRGGPRGLYQSRLVPKLSPPSPSIPVISAPFSGSRSTPSGRHTHMQASHARYWDWKNFFINSVHYFISLEQKKKKKKNQMNRTYWT